MSNVVGHGHSRSCILPNTPILATGDGDYAAVSCMIDTKDMTRLNVTLVETRQATGAPTGLSIAQYYAIYDPLNPPAGIIEDAEFDIIDSYVAPAASSGVPLIQVNGWNVNIDVMKRLVIYTITNLDSSNGADLLMLIDYN